MQQTLFDHDAKPDPPKPERRQPAAQSTEYARRVRDAIFEFLRERGEHGGTDAEIQAALELDGNTQRPKRIELENDGMICDSGRKRLTPKNRPAHVWVIAQHAKPAEDKPPAPPVGPPRELPKPVDVTREKPTATGPDARRHDRREEKFGPILDAMPAEKLEAICIEIFPSWPRISGLGPHDWTPQAARKNPYTRKLLLAAIEDSHREAP